MTAKPKVHYIAGGSEFEQVLVTRTDDATEARKIAAEAMEYDGSILDAFGINEGEAAEWSGLKEGRPGWYRINPCPPWERDMWGWSWRLGYADGPGPGNFRGVLFG